MNSKFFLSSLFLSICMTFSADAKENLASEHDLKREDKQDFACKSLPGEGTCFEQNQGTIFGGKHFTWSPFSDSPSRASSASVAPPPPYKVDADGLPIPPQK